MYDGLEKSHERLPAQQEMGGCRGVSLVTQVMHLTDCVTPWRPFRNDPASLSSARKTEIDKRLRFCLGSDLTILRPSDGKDETCYVCESETSVNVVAAQYKNALVREIEKW